MFTSSWKVTSTWSQTQKSNVSICSQPDLNCQCATACALYPNHKRDSNDACSLWNQKRHSFGRKPKSTTQAAVRMITKHHSAHLVTWHTAYREGPQDACPPRYQKWWNCSHPHSVVSRQNMLARNNPLRSKPENDSQDACSLHHNKTQLPGPIPESNKQAFAHNTTAHASAQPAPLLSALITVNSN